MAYGLVYHDLVAISMRDRAGIYWLRLFRRSDDAIAVVTEVPGNPGPSVTNGIEQIVEQVRGRFGPLGGLRVYEIWPHGAPGVDQPEVRKVALGRLVSWTRVPRSSLEGVVGTTLRALPAHDALYERVLELGGGNKARESREVFEPYPVAELPYPHLPSRCQHRARFEALLARSPETGKWSRDGHVAVGKAFVDSLTPDDLRTCPYHDGDWRLVAEESVRILEEAPAAERDEWIPAARDSHLPAREQLWLLSLFADPIEFHSATYVNGQHRGCALRYSGAARAAVVTHREWLGEKSDDWTYEGGG